MKILPPYYGSVFIMRKAPTCKGMRHIDLWRFKSMKSGKTYLVAVEAYEKHIYGIKFYLKSQAHLQEKYSSKMAYNQVFYKSIRIFYKKV